MAIPTLSTRALLFARASLALLLVAFVLWSRPAFAAPCAGFIDVDDADPFCTYVEWMKNRSITLGCTVNQYCPGGAVTRLQMAAFMNRLGNVAFQQGGNAFGANATLGTSDNQPLYLQANGLTGWRIAPTTPDPANGLDSATPNLIGGWVQNAASAGVIGAKIGGGGGQLGDGGGGDPYPNQVTDHYGTVGGGAGNTAGDAAGTVRDSQFATIGGGLANTASGSYSAIGGGFVNFALGFSSTIGGGFSNIASGSGSTVGGGSRNIASGDYSMASGFMSEARGDYSIALGHRAKTFSGLFTANGAIVLADGNDFDFGEFTPNRFAVRATGGVRLVLGIDGNGAATWTCGASNSSGWACSSDRSLKQNLVALDGRAVLERLSALPIYQWQPKDTGIEVRHYGPMAQDFHAAFGLGDTDKSIGFQDADGVALAAIQGLNTKLETTLAEIAELRRRHEGELAELRRTVAVLMARTPSDATIAQGGGQDLSAGERP